MTGDRLQITDDRLQMTVSDSESKLQRILGVGSVEDSSKPAHI
jgi:hypothetical protein